ncbi:nucleotidyltransferase family protein [Nocardioides maradonensis]
MHIDPRDGVALGQAMVDRLARDLGARVLAIKGPVPAAHGLLPAHASADVDVLVAPDDVAIVCDGLRELGWSVVPVNDDARFLAHHSSTMTHPAWPVTIDVHRVFPGFLASPTEVFDALWSERIDLPIAGQTVTATGLCGSTLVAALHALRDPHLRESERDLSRLVEAWAGMAERRATLRQLAESTGAAQSAAPLLSRLGLVARPPTGPLDAGLEEWRSNAQIGHVRGIGWVREFREAPLRRWPALLVRLLVTDDERTLNDYGMAADGAGRLRAHLRRISQLVRDSPRALRTAFHHRQVLRRLTRKGGARR